MVRLIQRSAFRSVAQVTKSAVCGGFTGCSNVRPEQLQSAQYLPKGLMEPVQHADTGHGRGSQIMLDTDIHTAQTARGTRPSALGDLRFAGTVATGLVAGTLGLGALAAPLVGWRDWPAGLSTSGSAGTAHLATPTPNTSQATKPGGGRSGTGPAGRPTPGGATALTGLGIPGTTGGSPLGTGGISLTNGITSTPNPERSSSATRGTTESGSTTKGTFEPVGFDKPSGDTDRDGLPDDFEQRHNLDPNNPADGAADPGTGMSRSTEFQIRSEIANPDQNGDGVVDGRDDSDNDGIPNGVEEANGTSAWTSDTDGNGIPDGQEDNNHNGVPDSVDWETPATPVVETPPEPVVPTTPPADETPAPPAPETPAPAPEPEAPVTPPVAETPAPAPPAEEAPAPPPAEEAPAPPPAEQPPAESAPVETAAAEAPEAPAPEPEAPKQGSPPGWPAPPPRRSGSGSRRSGSRSRSGRSGRSGSGARR